MERGYRQTGHLVRVLFIDYRKAFDLINHDLLITKLVETGLSTHIVRSMAAFLLNRQQEVQIGEVVSTPGYPNVGVPQGTLSGPLYKYVDDCTVFDIICSHTRVSMLQDSVDIVANWTTENDRCIIASKT